MDPALAWAIVGLVLVIAELLSGTFYLLMLAVAAFGAAAAAYYGQSFPVQCIVAAVLAAALFALGHLLEPAPWRLFVFFPALIFAWLRARTGTIVGAAICHFIFNVTLLLLERAAFA